MRSQGVWQLARHSFQSPVSFSRSVDLARRVVVTGLGLVTPIGNTVETTWAALMSGQSGVDYIKRFDTENFL